MKDPKGGVTSCKPVPLTCRAGAGPDFVREEEETPQEEMEALSGERIRSFRGLREGGVAPGQVFILRTQRG